MDEAHAPALQLQAIGGKTCWYRSGVWNPVDQILRIHVIVQGTLPVEDSVAKRCPGPTDACLEIPLVVVRDLLRQAGFEVIRLFALGGASR